MYKNNLDLNFLNSLTDLNPKLAKEFKEFVEKYMEDVNWTKLFKNSFQLKSNTYFEHLPIAMQFGIFTEFFAKRESEIDFEEFCKEFITKSFLK